MKKVIVTGATGFIGRNLVKKLIELDYFVYAIVRPNSSNRNKLVATKNLNIIDLDLSKIEKLPDFIGSKCDIFCHLAWDGTRGDDRNNKVLQRSNYLNSIKTIKVAKKLGCNIYIAAGSQAEYGVCDTKIDENMICNPNTEYGIQKYEFFKDGAFLAKELSISFKEARIFSLYGIGDYGNTMICSTLKKMINNENIDLTEASNSWNFLYIDDAVDGIVKLITTKCVDGAYNFSGDETKKLRYFVETMKKSSKSKCLIKFGAIPYPKSGVVNLIPDNSKLKSETNWSPKINFETGISNMINDFIINH